MTGAATGTMFHLTGDLRGARLLGWIRDRAQLLNLAGWVSRQSPHAVTIVVCGPDALVDAMEMACSLGPMEVFVDRIDRAVHPIATRPNGFHIRD